MYNFNRRLATMKYLDKVKLTVDRDRYKKDNVFKGEIGIIWLPEIRENEFYVAFETGNQKDRYKYSCIKIEDLELVEDRGCSNEDILDGIPKNNPKWWCKVEGGYILNLLGEKKNKIPYDYNS